MKHRNKILTGLILLSFPLMGGINSKETFGCACSGSENLVAPAGGTASSENYVIDRSGIGTSFEAMTSTSGSYRVNSTLGFPLSEGSALSSDYRITHPLSYKAFAPP